MAYSRWDRRPDALGLHERLNRLGSEEAPGWTPAVDLYETADRFVVSLELPSLTRDDIRIDLHEQTLVIRGERPCQTPGEARFLRVERGHGAFVRSFALPQPVRDSDMSAEFRRGVLTVLVPKASPGPRRIIVT
ncbi:MAG: Hsp20/alpha crystallin family protein [Acidobacteriota bacterium]